MDKKRQSDLVNIIRIIVAAVLLIMVVVGGNWLLLVLPAVLLFQVWKKSDCVYCEAGFCSKEE